MEHPLGASLLAHLLTDVVAQTIHKTVRTSMASLGVWSILCVNYEQAELNSKLKIW